jgi:hypothetical protein
MKRYPALLLIGISLFALSARAGESKIEGIVRDENDRPLTNKPVEVVNEAPPHQLTTVKTNNSGLFVAAGLTPGSYTVDVVVNRETRRLRHQVIAASDKTTHVAMTSKSLAGARRQVVWVWDPTNASMQKVSTLDLQQWENDMRRLGLYVH